MKHITLGLIILSMFLPIRSFGNDQDAKENLFKKLSIVSKVKLINYKKLSDNQYLLTLSFLILPYNSCQEKYAGLAYGGFDTYSVVYKTKPLEKCSGIGKPRVVSHDVLVSFKNPFSNKTEFKINETKYFVSKTERNDLQLKKQKGRHLITVRSRTVPIPWRHARSPGIILKGDETDFDPVINWMAKGRGDPKRRKKYILKNYGQIFEYLKNHTPITKDFFKEGKFATLFDKGYFVAMDSRFNFRLRMLDILVKVKGRYAFAFYRISPKYANLAKRPENINRNQYPYLLVFRKAVIWDAKIK